VLCVEEGCVVCGGGVCCVWRRGVLCVEEGCVVCGGVPQQRLCRCLGLNEAEPPPRGAALQGA
jgi:hypothetical protein